MDVTESTGGEERAPWLFFMFQLPARRASERVSVWRKLQKYGALAWKNSAYVLPHTTANLEKFQWLKAQIHKSGGEASVVRVTRIEDASEGEIVGLFNVARARDYEQMIRDLRLSLRGANRGKAAGLVSLARHNRRLDEIKSMDFFACGRRIEAETLMRELEARSHTAPPSGGTDKKKTGTYRGRVWMTRPRPEIDRVGSAWLIKHFIDPRGKFIFSADPRLHPGAVRFDMFEGEFTHVGEDCTFETLIKRFSVEDERVRLIAQIVHDADLEDGKFGRAEAKGLDLIFKGLARMDWTDEEILRHGFELYDALYLTLGS